MSQALDFSALVPKGATILSYKLSDDNNHLYLMSSWDSSAADRMINIMWYSHAPWINKTPNVAITELAYWNFAAPRSITITEDYFKALVGLLFQTGADSDPWITGEIIARWTVSGAV